MPRTRGSRVICYTLQIYFDFSGYSDMAIGLGRMFGFHFPENFRWPYIADTVQEFWRRWHMSLSSWFRDYLYVPLGGNRVSPARMYRNLVTVFFLCGLWHGASWNFVIWGIFHGTFLVLERLGLASAVKRLLAAAAARVSAARRDDRVGVLPRRHAAERNVVPSDDVRFSGPTGADAVHARRGTSRRNCGWRSYLE